MKSMKTLLLGTAIMAVSSAAFAHDNYKTQLDNLNSAWECQDHFDRGTDIAGSIDEFEFCVWHLNNNRKGFLRNDMFYDILPSGEVFAIKANQLKTKQSAEKAITAAINTIIEEKIVKVEVPVPGPTVTVEKIVEVEKTVTEYITVTEEVEKIVTEYVDTPTYSWDLVQNELHTIIDSYEGIYEDNEDRLNELRDMVNGSANIETFVNAIWDDAYQSGMTDAPVKIVEKIVTETVTEYVEVPGPTVYETVYVDREVIVEKIIEVESGPIIDGLNEQLTEANAALMEAASQAEIDTKEITRLAGEVASISTTLTTVQNAASELAETVQRLEDAAIVTAADITNLSTMVEAQAETIKDLASDLYLEEVKVGQLQREIDDLVTLRDNLTETNKDLQERINTVVSERDDALADVTTLTEELEGFAGYISPEAVEELQAAARTEGYEYAIPYITAAQNEARLANLQVDALTADVTNLTTQIETLAEEKQDLQDIIDDFDITADNADAIADFLGTFDADELAEKATNALHWSTGTNQITHGTETLTGYSTDLFGDGTAINVGFRINDWFDYGVLLDASAVSYYLEEGDMESLVSHVTNHANEIYRIAYNTGYDEGYDAGYKDGFRDGVNHVKDNQ